MQTLLYIARAASDLVRAPSKDDTLASKMLAMVNEVVKSKVAMQNGRLDFGSCPISAIPSDFRNDWQLCDHFEPRRWQ